MRKASIGLVIIIALIFMILIFILTNRVGVQNSNTSPDDKNMAEINNSVQKNYCSGGSRQGKFCIEIYQPVCGWFNFSIKCVKYPCAQTFSNGCFACHDLNVEYWTDGECPI